MPRELSDINWTDFNKYSDEASSDWGSSSPQNKYGSGRSGGFGWGDAFRYAGQALNGISKNRYSDDMSGQYGGRGFGSAGFSGGGMQKEGDLTAVYPNQHGPVYIQGQQGSPGLGGTIGSLVGTIGGALIGGPVGASLGSQIGGGIGGMF